MIVLSQRTHLGNVWGSSFAYLLAQLETEKPILAIVAGLTEAEDLVQDLETFGARPMHLPELGHLEAPSPMLVSERLRVAMARPSILVASVRAALEPIDDPEFVRAARLRLKEGDRLPMQQLVRRLVDANYTRVSAVESQGEFAVRGGLLDLFPLGAALPLRLEFVGETIESIRAFRVDDQASLDAAPELETYLAPVGRLGDAFVTEYLGAGVVVAWNDLIQIEERLRRFAEDPKYWHERLSRLRSETESQSQIIASPLPVPGPDGINLPITSVQRFQGNLVNLPAELSEFAARHERVVVHCSNEGERDRFQKLLRDMKIRLANLEVRLGRLSRGFVYDRTAHVSNHELFNRYQVRRTLRKAGGRPLESVLELEPGDFVVHKHYGIGRFVGIQRLQRQGVESEAVTLEYHGGSRLHVPVQDISLISKYIAATDSPPALNSLTGTGWLNTRLGAEKGAQQLAREMLEVQAKRHLAGGFAFPPDDEMQTLFEAEFPYEDTDDQARITQELKRDMMSPRAMDRLLCGDVGFGKTELAMRAAFKCVTSGKQVALLCPTTVLAQQHYQTFRERMADYPIQIDVLSRFRSRAEQADVLRRLAAGSLDIVIGTHRLLQPDVHFKDLGLIVIDEEQRFGVEQKERFKRLRATVDILTMTATPIPRTLHLALLNIKDISVLSTPPVERLAVKTKVTFYDEQLIRDAILFELERGGQVFFIHNRVENIRDIAERVQAVVPEARIAFGHGQMNAEELEETMLKFISGQVDVLVSTTIIENGIDIPNVNTIIINNADLFGLSDLHQLRGRVGRYNRQAYAYLLIPMDRPLTPESARRLKTIEEFSELGAGFKIAMRDMEIRGVGNILGREQHGHIRAVGYELYLELLDREVRRIQKQPVEEAPECSVSLLAPAYIPEHVIPDLPARIEAYRLISRCKSAREVDEVRSSIQDRFGKPPEPMANLFTVQRLKIAAARWRLTSVAETKEYFIAKYFDGRMAKKLRERDPQLVRGVDHETLYFAKPVTVERLIDFLSA